MPQLDRFTYLTQITWAAIIFGGFYLHCIQSFLPAISTVRKLREKKLNLLQGNSLGSETNSSANSGSNSIVDQILQLGLSYSGKAITQTSSHIKQSTQKIFKSSGWEALNSYGITYASIFNGTQMWSSLLIRSSLKEKSQSVLQSSFPYWFF